MSQLRVGSITDAAGNNALTLSPVSVYNTGVLQSLQVTDSSIVNFGGSWTQLGNLLINFTPKSTTSKILITANVSGKNTQTNDWHLYSIRLRVGSDYPYYRYVGTHFFQAYVPVEVTFQVDSWGAGARQIAVEAASHASNVHQLNAKAWDPAAGAHANTSLLRITEFQTL
jgi:hypothetical protein